MDSTLQEIEARMQTRFLNNFLEACATDCFKTFKEPKLTAAETTCLQNCLARNASAMEAGLKYQQESRQGSQGGAF